jgi:hypothetical protein
MSTFDPKRILKRIGVMRNPDHPYSWGSRTGKPEYPESCPVCGSASQEPGQYECGAKYEQISQCQTHTAIYTGYCPAGECQGCYATPCVCLPDDCNCDPA